MAECPSRYVLAALSDKWVTLVLTALADGPRRYSQLARQIVGVSQKMLTQTLRTLERNGLLTGTITPSVPTKPIEPEQALAERIQQRRVQILSRSIAWFRRGQSRRRHRSLLR